uniref:Odorant-binding protein 16 n=1 Tax=Tropidothorax elegans TaxID=2233830 RepID=A0A2Z5EM86_9HEMI|nr:odorant-binding protein 16 [Tropidothorax elegans]
MKYTVSLFSLFAVICLTAAIPPDYVKKISSYIETCTQKHGTNKDDVMKVLLEKVLPETHDLKCTLDCYMGEAGYIKEGKLDWEAAKASNVEKYSDDPESLEKANKIVDTCKEKVNIDGKKECEFSDVILDCIYAESKAVNLKTPDFLKAAKE